MCNQSFDHYAATTTTQLQNHTTLNTYCNNQAQADATQYMAEEEAQRNEEAQRERARERRRSMAAEKAGKDSRGSGGEGDAEGEPVGRDDGAEGVHGDGGRALRTQMSFEDPSANDAQSERRLRRVGTLEDEDEEEELEPLESPINGPSTGRQSVPAPLVVEKSSPSPSRIPSLRGKVIPMPILTPVPTPMPVPMLTLISAAYSQPCGICVARA